jgi:DNA-binding XRE family transcriptional regulator
MTIELSAVRAKLPKTVVKAADQKTKKMLQEMKLSEVRQFQGITQEKLAHKLQVKQSSLSKFESRANVRLDTLKEHVEAMGGKLQVQAVFKDFIIPLHIGR